MPPIYRPFNYVRIVTITTVMLGVVSFFSIAYPYILPVVQNRNLWAALSLITILLFTSGHMFNHIRKVPYVAGDGKGGISYFAGGFSNQFGMETQIVAAMCKLYLYHPLGCRLCPLNRWNSVIRNHSSGIKGSPDARPEKTTTGGLFVGCSNAGHVQFPYECFQDQKWRLSIPLTSILEDRRRLGIGN